jgi:hypothetical protein
MERKKYKINSVKGSSVEYYNTVEANYFTIENRQILIYLDNRMIGSFPSRFFSIEEI